MHSNDASFGQTMPLPSRVSRWLFVAAGVLTISFAFDSSRANPAVPDPHVINIPERLQSGDNAPTWNCATATLRHVPPEVALSFCRTELTDLEGSRKRLVNSNGLWIDPALNDLDFKIAEDNEVIKGLEERLGKTPSEPDETPAPVRRHLVPKRQTVPGGRRAVTRDGCGRLVLRHARTEASPVDGPAWRRAARATLPNRTHPRSAGR
jgi:hypothetical protein